jgi:hypothetical protein
MSIIVDYFLFPFQGAEGARMIDFGGTPKSICWKGN